MSRKKKKWLILPAIIVVLIIIRLILPFVILSYANKTLSHLKGYRGHINHIGLTIIRGEYKLKEAYIDKIDTTLTHPKLVPFIAAATVNLAVDWKSLWHKKIVGRVNFIDPVIRFTKDKVTPDIVQKDTVDFRRVLNRLMPLKINSLEMKNGNIQFIDSASKPAVNIFMDSVYIVASNLTNVRDTSVLPAFIQSSGKIYGGKFNLKMKLDPLSNPPPFVINFQLENTNLPDLNAFFKAYGNIDVSRGTFGLYAEVAGKEGKFIGYVKPVIKDLKVLGPQDRNTTFFHKLWESIVGVAASILKNKKESQVATKVPLSGEYGKTSVKVWYAVVNILRNAFVQAIYPALDHEISLSSVNALDNKKEREKELKKLSKDRPSKKK